MFYQDCENVCVMFETIANFFEFYAELYNDLSRSLTTIEVKMTGLSGVRA